MRGPRCLGYAPGFYLTQTGQGEVDKTPSGLEGSYL
jgi:hypothetical protein